MKKLTTNTLVIDDKFLEDSDEIQELLRQDRISEFSNCEDENLPKILELICYTSKFLSSQTDSVEAIHFELPDSIYDDIYKYKKAIEELYSISPVEEWEYGSNLNGFGEALEIRLLGVGELPDNYNFMNVKIFNQGEVNLTRRMLMSLDAPKGAWAIDLKRAISDFKYKTEQASLVKQAEPDQTKTSGVMFDPNMKQYVSMASDGIIGHFDHHADALGYSLEGSPEPQKGMKDAGFNSDPAKRLTFRLNDDFSYGYKPIKWKKP